MITLPNCSILNADTNRLSSQLRKVAMEREGGELPDFTLVITLLGDTGRRAAAKYASVTALPKIGHFYRQ